MNTLVSFKLHKEVSLEMFELVAFEQWPDVGIVNSMGVHLMDLRGLAMNEAFPILGDLAHLTESGFSVKYGVIK